MLNSIVVATAIIITAVFHSHAQINLDADTDCDVVNSGSWAIRGRNRSAGYYPIGIQAASKESETSLGAKINSSYLGMQVNANSSWGPGDWATGIEVNADDVGLDVTGYYRSAFFFGANAVAPGWETWSDLRLKTNIRNLKNEYGAQNSALDKVMEMRPIKYSYDQEKLRQYDAELPAEERIGFGAQDLEKLVPEAVSILQMRKRRDGQDFTPQTKADSSYVADPSNIVVEEMKAINYDALIPVLVAAIQEQQEEIEKLKTHKASR